MALKIFRQKYCSYQVCITILEAKHLPQNANPLVVVKVGDKKRKTVVRERTDNPIYNEYFVFDFTCELEVLLGTRIMIAVYLRNCLRRLKFHGSIVLEAATVWDQPDHQYHHKWALLTNPKNLSTGSKGYVKCNIAINAKGEKMKAHPETDGEDDIEGNLLLPRGAGYLPLRQRARYVFTVYRADGLPSMATWCTVADSASINPFVQISFAGMKGSTKQCWRTRYPDFDERIIFKEMFPPLCQRVRIAIKHRINSYRSCLVTERLLNLSEISHSGEYGFLPTFGPSFLHLYARGSEDKNSCCSCKCQAAEPSYRGRVLLSLKTEMDDPEAASGIGVETEPTPSIKETSLWKIEEYYLVAVIYDASMIDRHRSSGKIIQFEISLGNAGNWQFPTNHYTIQENNDGSRMPQERPDFESQTPPRMTGSFDGKYNYLPLASRKPCLHVRSSWPNLDWRMHNSNAVRFIADFLEEQLAILEEQIIQENSEAYRKYNATIRSLKSHCIRYLRFLDTARYDNEGGTTKLDQYRVNLSRKEIETILKRLKINGELPNNNYIRIAMVHAYHCLTKLRQLSHDPQDSLPDVFIWMITGSKRIACARMPAQDLLYAEDPSERGKLCQRKINVFVKYHEADESESDSEDSVAAKLELFLWLGSGRYLAACWASIPPGYDIDHRINPIDHFPKFLEYTSSTAFQLRAHIFQGRFDPGMDASGLLDPVVRVAFHGYTATTKVIKQTLDPVWDQTLILPAVTLYGTPEYLKAEPPAVVVEVFDQDICGTMEFCGRCLAFPLVKLSGETYSPPDFPPKLQWYKFKSRREYSSSVLAAFELIETGENEVADVPMAESKSTVVEQIYGIPGDIRPRMTSYRLEVVFWGVRDMKKINYVAVLRPRIIIECAGVRVKSEVLQNAKKFANFEEPHILVDLEMPELDIYYPSLTIKAYDSRGFGCFKFVGICIVPSVNMFMERPIAEKEYLAQIYENKSPSKSLRKGSATILPLPLDYDPSKDENKGLIAYNKMTTRFAPLNIGRLFKLIKQTLQRFLGPKTAVIRDESKDERLDWWSKYFASLERERNERAGHVPVNNGLASFEIFDSELEKQPQFEGFQDRLRTFELWRGKRIDNLNYNEANSAGKFKGRICVYRWSEEDKSSYMTKSGRNAVNGLCDDYPSPEQLNLLVRIYIVRGINLQPKDPLTGKSDPYLCITLGRRIINDRVNYIPNQLNPTFGRVFEIEATFPRDYLLIIEVWDYDSTSGDDLIGSTQIDLENRFYSRHRGSCGISRIYNRQGYNSWRDREKPVQILDGLCKRNNLPTAEYSDNYVRIGKKSFPYEGNSEPEADRKECMALNALHHWREFPICGCDLVPEHVERRPLFNATRPGLEQGKLELWIDMFPPGQLPLKPAIDITPQPAEEYEIRAIVWNTEDVPLVESQFLTGEKSSDIYVKGKHSWKYHEKKCSFDIFYIKNPNSRWILYEDYQKTDVHYGSLNGEGNFNWRFVFRVMYSKSENAMIVRKKLSLLSRNETEEKLPCRLHLQVWDSDHFSSDDFLGALTLDLSKMPRGSGNAKCCSLKLLDPHSPTINLFKAGRIRGWWPFACSSNGGSYAQAGKIELEVSVVSIAEAEERPAGKGRDPPQSLPPPRRPDTSFSWFRNPWKACRYVLCRYYKWRIMCCLSCVLLSLLVACGIYAFPGYFVKRLLGA